MSSRSRPSWARSTAEFLCLLLLTAGALGCSSARSPYALFYEDRDFAGAMQALEPLAQEEGPDRILLLNEYAASALAAGDLDRAREAFGRSQALLHGTTGSAFRNFMAMAFGESWKVYRGDPYERAMVSLFAGLLAFAEGDFETARASFKNASLEDSGSEASRFDADFTSAYLFEALCARHMGDADEAARLFELAIRSRAGQRANPFLRSAAARRANLVVLVAAGHAPRKVGIGPYEELAVFRPVPTPESYAEVRLDGELIGRTHELEDLTYQAVTRGGRYMDDFLRTKATVKTTVRNAGSVLLVSGLALAAASRNNDQRQVAAILIVSGVASWVISWAITPEADTRHWRTLPAKLDLFMGEVDPGRHTLELSFFGERGEPLPGLYQVVDPVEVASSRETLVLVRSVAPGLTAAIADG